MANLKLINPNSLDLSDEILEELSNGREDGEKEEFLKAVLLKAIHYSSLVSYIKLSPNCTSPRNHIIDTITIHCMAGNATVETCGNIFAPSSRQASSNYGIGTDGRIALYVDESNRSWATSSQSNDHRAITIEVANDGDASTGWHVSDEAYISLINLVADICKRNNIKQLLWQGDNSLIGQTNQQNMTVHRWFANKACCGDYLYNKHFDIANEVNNRLNQDNQEEDEVTTTAITASMNGKDTKLTSIIYNGENYVRIRDLADAQSDDKLTVSWDSANSKVIITSK